MPLDQEVIELRLAAKEAGQEYVEDLPFFGLMKELTLVGYYTSEIGIDELNKGGRVPKSFACEHEGH